MRLAGRLIDSGSLYLLRGPLADPSQSLRNQAGVVADRSVFETINTSTWSGAGKGFYVGIDSTAKTQVLLWSGSKTRAALGFWR